MTKTEQGLRILAVDDSPISRKLLEHALCDGPYSLLFAKSGDEALRLFKEHRPAVVITDWMLPDLSGPELCERIRSDAQDSYTYIILVTSMDKTDNVVQGLAAGADDYLTKPFGAHELQARIEVGRRIIDLHREKEPKGRHLAEMERTDQLTGLPNNRAMEEWTARQLRGAERHGFALWITKANLDSFKHINDSYGKDAGEAVLKKFAEVLKANTRASDICGRMGGDEFLLVITHIEEKNIRLAVDRLREKFASQKFSFGGVEISVTASFGIVGFQGKEAPDFTTLVQQAEKALRSAKRDGRNQINLEMASLAQTCRQ